MDSNLSIGCGVPLTLVRAVEIALVNSPKPEQAVQAILVAEPHVLNFLLRRNRARRNLLAKEHDFGIQRTILAKVMGLPDAFFDKQIQLVPFPFDQINTFSLAPMEACLSTAREQRPNFLALKSFRPDHSLTGTIGFDANGNAVKKQFSFGQIALE